MATLAISLRRKPSKGDPRTEKNVPQHDAELSTPQFAWVIEDDELLNKASKSHASQNLQFVSETGTARPRGTYRSLIRSQAKRGRTKTGAAEAESQFGTKGKLVYQQEPLSKARMQLRTSSDLAMGGPGTGTKDPFDSLPIVSNNHIRGLLSHWDKIFRYSYAPPNPRDKWLPLALTDAAFLNSTLFVTALNICGLKATPLSPDVFYFKGETIRNINKRLGNPKEKATDGMISAVASLAQLENLSGTRESAKIHMDGLEAMVKSRGGLQALGGWGVPRRQAAWSDTCAALFLGTPPRFNLAIANGFENPADWKPYSSLALQYQDKLLDLTGSETLSEEMINIYWGLRNLAAMKDEATFLLSSKLDLMPYSDLLQGLEHRLVAIVQDNMFVDPVRELAIYPLFANAAILHIYMFMRDLSRGLPFFHLISCRVRALLENVDMSELKRQYPEVLLWILMLGGLCGLEHSERLWFAGLMADFCFELGVKSGDELASKLSGFFWSEFYRSPMTMGFWIEVSKAQGFDGEFGVRKLADHVAVAIFNAPADTAA